MTGPPHTLNWTCLLVPAGTLPVDDGPECQACRIQITREALAERQCNACRFPGTCGKFSRCALEQASRKPEALSQHATDSPQGDQ